VGLITAFDSGTYTGWAQAQHGRIVACGLIKVLKDQPMAKLPASGGGLVIIEKPIHRRHGKTVDANDLITLGIKVGRLVETYLVLGNTVRTVLPTDWKGGTPKDIQNQRDWNNLQTDERRSIGAILAELAPSYRNNVLDAIGIALWAARQEKDRT
jgi:hypothetical protein